MAVLAGIVESIGALATAGALLLGAFTFLRQYLDHRREQASRVIVGGGSAPKWWVKNYSHMPVFDVRFRNPDRSETDRIARVDPGEEHERAVETELLTVSATFRDAAGRWWERSSDGKIKYRGR